MQKNREIDLDAIFRDADNIEQTPRKYTIALEYTEEDYFEVIEALKKHTGTKEAIFFRLLNL